MNKRSVHGDRKLGESLCSCERRKKKRTHRKGSFIFLDDNPRHRFDGSLDWWSFRAIGLSTVPEQSTKGEGWAVRNKRRTLWTHIHRRGRNFESFESSTHMDFWKGIQYLIVSKHYIGYWMSECFVWDSSHDDQLLSYMGISRTKMISFLHRIYIMLLLEIISCELLSFYTLWLMLP